MTVEGKTIKVGATPAGFTPDAGAGKIAQRLDEPYNSLRTLRHPLGVENIAILRIDRDETAFVAKSVLYSAAFAGYTTLFAVRDKTGREQCLPVETVLHYDFDLISGHREEDGLHIDARDGTGFAVAWRGGDAAVDEVAHASSLPDLTNVIRAKWPAKGAHPMARYLHVASATDLATVLGWVDFLRSTEPGGPVYTVLSVD